jgi:very-short-patch-repair endonuclease
MPTALDDLLEANGLVAARSQLLAIMSRASADDRIRRGELVAVFPRAYARPWDADLPDVRLRAALVSVGGEAALSHVTALDRWSLPVPAGPIHVTAFNPRHPRGVPDELIVHRTLLPLEAVFRDGLAVVRPELAVVTSWPWLSGSDQRAPLIEGAQRRLFRPERIAELAERMWWTAERETLLDVTRLVLAGCHSPLEMWGYTDVFTVPGLLHADRQRKVSVDGKTYWLDQFYEPEMLDVELDGRKYHSSPAQRENDIARDIAVAKLGVQTIRLSHDRLREDVEGCRRDTLEVLAARRRLAS